MDLLFELPLTRPSAPAAVRGLFEQLRSAILEGRLASGARLPPTRRAKALLGVSRNTAAEVYDRLAQEGLLVARRGSGTYVADAVARRSGEARSAAAIRINPVWSDPAIEADIGFWGTSDGNGEGPWIADFRPALVDSRLFPLDVFRRVMAKELRRLENRPPRLKSPQGNQGNHHLRCAIAQHIAVTRAVACDPAAIVVTAGAQQAFDLLARVLVIPGETVVAMEDPGYPPMRAAFRAAGGRVVPVPVDDEGLCVDRLPADADLICVCPSHQFPLGMTMSAERRAALVAFARRRGAVVVEDDYDGEFRYDGAPVAALRTAENADVVAYVGTVSKCMLPSLRLGFVVLPEAIRRPFVTAKNAQDWHCPTPMQAGVAAFIAEGHLTRHIRRMRGIYKRRRQRLVDGIADLALPFDVIPSCYGMHITALERAPGEAARTAAALLRRGVLAHTTDRYESSTARPGLILGYGVVDEQRIDRVMTMMAER